MTRICICLLPAVFLCSGGIASAFDQTGPLAGPADGDVFLFIDDLGGSMDSTFVAINTGVIIQDINTYSITAATGHAAGQQLANQSIQAWSTPVTGVSDIDAREFISQDFSGSGGLWNDAPDGEWVDNEHFFVGSPAEAGEELIILLTNFSLASQPGSTNPADTGVAYWDNFRVLENGLQVFQDSFETGLTVGTEGEVTDAGWNIGNSTVENSGLGTVAIVPPEPEPAPPGPRQVVNFNEVNPVAAPANGNSMLFIDDLGGAAENSFVAVNTGVVMSDSNTYAIQAATGHANGQVLAKQSIQAWSTPTTGVNDLDDREFVGQAFTGAGGWLDAPEGEWVDNELFLVASPDEEGEELIILVSNFALGNEDPDEVGVAFWDNFRVLENGFEVFSEDFETGLSPGSEGEVADAAPWETPGATTTNSGIVAAVTADFDGNDITDGLDRAQWEASYGLNANADSNDDGVSGGVDFLFWQLLNGFGRGGPAPLSAVPEPSSLALCIMMLGVAAASRRRTP
ncbi:PEP-CTERM sorting domain-containing protein [Pirellulales bacterium]|nr:PEP-CTERM sorting domain-containing protein [Pirellulales bacterium]